MLTSRCCLHLLLFLSVAMNAKQRALVVRVTKPTGEVVERGSVTRIDEGKRIVFNITVPAGVTVAVTGPAWAKVGKASPTSYFLQCDPLSERGKHDLVGQHPVVLRASKGGARDEEYGFTLDVRRVWKLDDETVYIEPQATTGLVRGITRSNTIVAQIVRGEITFRPRGFNYWQSAFVPNPAMPDDMFWRLVLHTPDENGRDTKTNLSDVLSGMATVTTDTRAIPDGTYAVSYEFVQGSETPVFDINRYIERPIIVIVDNQVGPITGPQLLPIAAGSSDGYRNRWRGPMEAVQWVQYTSPSDKHAAHQPYPYRFATPPTTDAARTALANTANLVAETWLGPLNNRYTTESIFVQTAEGHPFVGALTWSGLDTSYLPFTKRFPERDGSRNNSALNPMTQFRPVPGPNPALVGIGVEGRVVRLDPQDAGDNLVTTIAGWVLDPDKLPYYDDSVNYDNAKRLVGSFAGNLLFRAPTDIAIDTISSNIAYIADVQNHRIASVDLTSGSVATFAGDVTIVDSYKVPVPGYLDGHRLAARFAAPSSVEIVGRVMYVADRNNHAVRAINLDSDQVTTVLGGPNARAVPADTVLAKERPKWTFPRISFDDSPIAYPLWVRQDSRGNLLVQEMGGEGRGTGNLRRLEFATREVVQVRAMTTLGASFEVDYLGRVGPVDDIIVKHVPNTSAIGRLAADGTVRGTLTVYGTPLYYGRGESNPLFTEGGSPYGVQVVIDDQEAKLGFTSVYRSGFTVMRPRLPTDPPATHDAALYDEGRAIDIAGTVLPFYPNRSRTGFAALHGRFGHNWLGSMATFDDITLKSDSDLAAYIQAGMDTGVPRPELTGKDLQSLIYFIRLSAMQGKLEQINPAKIASNLRQAGYWPDDKRPPVISNAQLMIDDATTVRVTWETDEPTIGLVAYGPSDSHGLHSAIESDYATTHEVTIAVANSAAPLYFAIKARDRAGKLTVWQK